MSDRPKTLSTWVRRKRLQANLSQADVVREMRREGVERDQSWLSQIENDKRSILNAEPAVALALAHALGVDREELLFVLGYVDEREPMSADDRLNRAMQELGEIIDDPDALLVIKNMVVYLREKQAEEGSGA